MNILTRYHNEYGQAEETVPTEYEFLPARRDVIYHRGAKYVVMYLEHSEISGSATVCAYEIFKGLTFMSVIYVDGIDNKTFNQYNFTEIELEGEDFTKQVADDICTSITLSLEFNLKDDMLIYVNENNVITYKGIWK